MQNTRSGLRPRAQYVSTDLAYWFLNFIEKSEQPPRTDDIAKRAFADGIYKPVSGAFARRSGCSWGANIGRLLAQFDLVRRTWKKKPGTKFGFFVYTSTKNGRQFIRENEQADEDDT